MENGVRFHLGHELGSLIGYLLLQMQASDWNGLKEVENSDRGPNFPRELGRGCVIDAPVVPEL
jgi:hypothetical protein